MMKYFVTYLIEQSMKFPLTYLESILIEFRSTKTFTIRKCSISYWFPISWGMGGNSLHCFSNAHHFLTLSFGCLGCETAVNGYNCTYINLKQVDKTLQSRIWSAFFKNSLSEKNFWPNAINEGAAWKSWEAPSLWHKPEIVKISAGCC